MSEERNYYGNEIGEGVDRRMTVTPAYFSSPESMIEAAGVNAVLVQIIDGRRVVSVVCRDRSKMPELEAEARHLMRHYGIDE